MMNHGIYWNIEKNLNKHRILMDLGVSQSKNHQLSTIVGDVKPQTPQIAAKVWSGAHQTGITSSTTGATLTKMQMPFIIFGSLVVGKCWEEGCHALHSSLCHGCFDAAQEPNPPPLRSPFPPPHKGAHPDLRISSSFSTSPFQRKYSRLRWFGGPAIEMRFCFTCRNDWNWCNICNISASNDTSISSARHLCQALSWKTSGCPTLPAPLMRS